MSHVPVTQLFVPAAEWNDTSEDQHRYFQIQVYRKMRGHPGTVGQYPLSVISVGAKQLQQNYTGNSQWNKWDGHLTLLTAGHARMRWWNSLESPAFFPSSNQTDSYGKYLL